MSARAPRSRTERNKRTLGAMPGQGSSPTAAGRPQPVPRPTPTTRAGTGPNPPVTK